MASERVGESRDRACWWLVCAALAVWAWHSLPILLGHEALYYRDLALNHFSLRWVGAEALRHGEIPAFVEQLGNGLPYRGNPAAVPFYPGNLLYLVLPFWSAFGGHLVLHWLLAGFTMYVLARVLGMSRWAAVTAGITYAGGGWFASTMTFYNIVAVVAWWPAVIAGGVRGGRLGIATGGLACGLALLGGEPLTASLGLVPLLLAVAIRHGLKRGVGTCLAIGTLGLLVALPQIVATASVIEYSSRGFQGASVDEMSHYAFQWSRLLELLMPFPFGHPGLRGAGGWWLTARLPFYFCLYSGVIGLALALGSLRRTDRSTTSRPWAMLGLLGVLLAWVGGVEGEFLVRLSAGLFRYPEKFLFWLGLAMPLLVGFGLDDLRSRSLQEQESSVAFRRVGRRGLLLTALLLVALAPLALRAAPALATALGVAREADEGPLKVELALETQAQRLALQLAAAGVLLAALGLLAPRGRYREVALLQLVSLLPVGTLVMTTPVAAYREAKLWLADLPPGSGAVDSRVMLPAWGLSRYLTTTEDFGAIYRVDAAVASPITLMPRGVNFPFKRDSEGLGQATYTFMARMTALRPWSERKNWLAVVGADAVISVEPKASPGLEVVDRRLIADAPLFRLRVEHPLPFAFSPIEVLPDSNPGETFLRVGQLADPIRTVITQHAVPDHHPGSIVSVVERGNDRVVLQVEGPGGLVVVRRLFHPLWRARSEGVALRTTAAQMVLIGIVVPPGSHRVVLEVPAGRDIAAGLVAVITALGCLVVAWRYRRDPEGGGAIP